MSNTKGGRRYPLVLYIHMMNRWRPAVFTLGLALFGLAGVLYYLGWDSWRWVTAVSIGTLNVFLSLLMLLARKSAYVQPFPTHLRLVTPFLRLNISYKRFRRTATVSMAETFPKTNLSNWQAEMLEPLAKMSAIYVELTGHPMSQTSLRFFLSPFFFKRKDKTPHILLLVEDWMRLSSEIESMRTGGGISSQQQRGNSILSKLPVKK